ncbi:hypothetical protein HDU96_005191 [Phlyctochytrium bullatum]|nr:hypothetical protein HDU96_005191 [Phlyctochytrium bullatum]
MKPMLPSTPSMNKSIPPSRPKLLDCSWYRPIRHRRIAGKTGRTTWEDLANEDEDLMVFPLYKEILEAGDEEVSWEDQRRDPKAEFRKRRIPGANFFDLDVIRDPLSTLPTILPLENEFAAHMDRLNITEKDHVILYDSTGIMTSPRVWWMFKAMGHKNVSVLDGGLRKWVRETRPLDLTELNVDDTEPGSTGSTPKDVTPTYKAVLNQTIVTDHQKMMVHAVDFMSPKHPLILDCRPEDRFLGTTLEYVPGLSNGRIPGSINLDWRYLVDEEHGTLLPPLDLIRAFKSKDIDLDRNFVLIGHDGVKSAIVFLALRVLGKTTGVSLYDGGWIDWACRSNSPIATF